MQSIAQLHDGENEVGGEAGVEAVRAIDVGPLVSENAEDVLSRLKIVGQAKRHEEHAKGVIDAHAREAEALDVSAEDVAVVLLGKVGADLVAVELEVLEDCERKRSAINTEDERWRDTH